MITTTTTPGTLKDPAKDFRSLPIHGTSLLLGFLFGAIFRFLSALVCFACFAPRLPSNQSNFAANNIVQRKF